MNEIKIYKNEDLDSDYKDLQLNLCSEIKKAILKGKKFIKIYFGFMCKKYTFIDDIIYILANEKGFSQISKLSKAKVLLMRHEIVFIVYAEQDNLLKLKKLVDQSVILIPTNQLHYKG